MWMHYFSNFETDQDYKREMFAYALKYASICFNNKKYMVELATFKKHFAEFDEIFNEMFQEEVAKKLSVVGEKIDRASSEMNLGLLREAQEELRMLGRKRNWWVEFIAYFNDCLNERIYDFKRLQ